MPLPRRATGVFRRKQPLPNSSDSAIAVLKEYFVQHNLTTPEQQIAALHQGIKIQKKHGNQAITSHIFLADGLLSESDIYANVVAISLLHWQDAKLGAGGYGVVKRGEFKKKSNNMPSDTSNLCAVKILDTEDAVVVFDSAEFALMQKMGKLLHTWFRTRDVATVDSRTQKLIQNKVYIVQVLEKGSTVLSALAHLDQKQQLQQHLEMACGILLETARIHQFGYIHRDLKFDNFIVDTDKEFVKVAAIDFGMAAKLPESGVIVTQTMHGTPQFLAPEIALFELDANQKVCYSEDGKPRYLAKTPENKQYSIASDVYALGMMLRTILPTKLGNSRTIKAMLDPKPRKRPDTITALLRLAAEPEFPVEIMHIIFEKFAELHLNVLLRGIREASNDLLMLYAIFDKLGGRNKAIAPTAIVATLQAKIFAAQFLHENWRDSKTLNLVSIAKWDPVIIANLSNTQRKQLITAIRKCYTAATLIQLQTLYKQKLGENTLIVLDPTVAQIIEKQLLSCKLAERLNKTPLDKQAILAYCASDECDPTALANLKDTDNQVLFAVIATTASAGESEIIKRKYEQYLDAQLALQNLSGLALQRAKYNDPVYMCLSKQYYIAKVLFNDITIQNIQNLLDENVPAAMLPFLCGSRKINSDTIISLFNESANIALLEQFCIKYQQALYEIGNDTAISHDLLLMALNKHLAVQAINGEWQKFSQISAASKHNIDQELATKKHQAVISLLKVCVSAKVPRQILPEVLAELQKSDFSIDTCLQQLNDKDLKLFLAFATKYLDNATDLANDPNCTVITEHLKRLYLPSTNSLNTNLVLFLDLSNRLPDIVVVLLIHKLIITPLNEEEQLKLIISKKDTLRDLQSKYAMGKALLGKGTVEPEGVVKFMEKVALQLGSYDLKRTLQEFARCCAKDKLIQGTIGELQMQKAIAVLQFCNDFKPQKLLLELLLEAKSQFNELGNCIRIVPIENLAVFQNLDLARLPASIVTALDIRKKSPTRIIARTSPGILISGQGVSMPLQEQTRKPPPPHHHTI